MTTYAIVLIIFVTIIFIQLIIINELRLKIKKLESEKGMTREETLKELNEFINNRSCISTSIIIEASKIYLKLLSIPQRDINNLQVGDYVEYKINDSYIIKNYMMNDSDLHLMKCKYNNKLGVKVEIIEIIPHEYLELWREIGNESNNN